MFSAQRFLTNILRRLSAPSDTRKPPALPEFVQTFLRQLPKAEIHLHFEGSVFAQTILELGRKYGIETIHDLSSAAECLSFSDAAMFFQQFLKVSSLLREPEDFYTAARGLGDRLFQENILYAEITFAPHKFMRTGIPYPDLIESIDRGLRDSVGGDRRDCRIIIDIVRDLGPQFGMETIKAVERYPHPRVVGIGLGGSEQYPSQDSAKVFEYAAAIGLRKTAHAGEGRGPESIWGAIRALGIERIDHGVRTCEDPELVEYLARNRIPLNQCPTSNAVLGVVPSLEAHPLRWYHERNIPINVGTDDPAFFQVSLTDELAHLIAYQGFTPQDIPGFIENAVHASFMSEAEKQSLLTRFRHETRGLLHALRSGEEG